MAGKRIAVIASVLGLALLVGAVSASGKDHHRQQAG